MNSSSDVRPLTSLVAVVNSVVAGNVGSSVRRTVVVVLVLVVVLVVVRVVVVVGVVAIVIVVGFGITQITHCATNVLSCIPLD